MKTALFILLLCAALDLVACLILLAIVWLEHRRIRSASAASGEPAPSAAGQFGCLIALVVVGLVAVYGTAWLLLD